MFTRPVGTFAWVRLYGSVICWIHRSPRWGAQASHHIDRYVQHSHS